MTNQSEKADHCLSSIVEPLLVWFADNKRSLPWRDDPTPYHVWLSEIMLQQTRIEAVLPYYHRFLSACPTVSSLAIVEDEALMKLWEGLGYYSRARNLKKAAQAIMQQYNGYLPANFDALRALPGIGAYTAGAIASIAYGLPEPAVDGNVLRVVTRLTGCTNDITKDATKRSVTEALRAIYPSGTAAGDLTQALMELGQRACIPNGEPHCNECPLSIFCRARAMDATDVIPVKSQKKPRRIEQRNVLLLICDNKIALRKREASGLLAGLWEFPNEEYTDEAQLQSFLREHGIAALSLERDIAATHIFTHIEWHMQGYVAVCAQQSEHFVWATPEQLTGEYAVPSAYRAYVKRALTLLA